MNQVREFIIIGHRGGVGIDGIGENTIPAFERALHDGADGIEFDVYAVSDASGKNHLVVIHDDDVGRATNGAGNIWDIGYERLRELKVGDEKTETVGEYQETVPNAIEVLDAVAKFDADTGKHSLINIELKGPSTAEPTAELIRAYLERGLDIDNFMVSSFNHQELIDFHNLIPEVKTAVLLDDEQYAAAGESLRPAIDLAHQLGSVAVNTSISFTSEYDIEALHANGLKAYVWTGESQEMVDKADEHVVQVYELGADGIFANKPGSGRKALELAQHSASI